MANKPRNGPVPLMAASPKKEVRIETQTAPKQTPVWVFSRVDLQGPWCWSKLESGELLQIIQRLKNLENIPSSEIERTTGSHPVSKVKFIKAAKDRLIESAADRYRFFWECWQNADDAHATLLRFEIRPGQLIIENTETAAVPRLLRSLSENRLQAKRAVNILLCHNV